MGKGFRVVFAMSIAAIAVSAYAGVTRDVPLLYQTLGTRNTPLTISGAPRGIAFDGRRVWAANFSPTTPIVYAIDIYTNQVVSQVQLQTGSPAATAFDGTYVWILTQYDLYRFDPNNPPTKTLSPTVTDSRIAGGINGLAFDGRYLWTAGNNSTVLAIDTTASPPAVAAAVATPFSLGSAVADVFDGHYVWFASSPGLAKIDPTTTPPALVYSTTAIVGAGHGINTIAWDGVNLWLLGSYATGMFVQEINPGTSTNPPTVVASIPMTSPWGIAFDGTFMWVTDESGTVSKIDVRNATLSGESYSFPGWIPYNVLYDGTHMWVSFVGGQIAKILVRGN